MTTEPALVNVGKQLQARREELDQTQEELGQRIGVTPTTVSAIERGRNAISRSKRPAWESALGLVTGTISRAYRSGGPIEVSSTDQATAEPAPDREEDRLHRALRRYLNDTGPRGVVLRNLVDTWDREDQRKEGGEGDAQDGRQVG